MNYLPLQIIVSLFVIFIVFRLTRKFRDNILKISEFIGWLLIWIVVLVIFWLPQTTSYLAIIFGIGRGVDLVTYISIISIFYLMFRLLLRIEKIEKEITTIIRNVALKNNKNEDEK